MRQLIQLFSLLTLLSIIGCSKDDSNSISEPIELALKWEQTELSNSDILALEINSEGNLYASVSEKGFYYSEDNGVTWMKNFDSEFMFQNSTAYANCIYSDSNQVWVGTSSAGVHHSFDNGINWVDLNHGMLMAQNFDLIRNNNFGNLICASANGTYKFGSAGWIRIHDEWANALCSNPDGVLLSFGPKPNSISESNVRISSDNGNTWTTKTMLGGINSAAIVGFKSIYAAGTTIHHTSNLGESWVQIISKIPAMINVIKIGSEGFIFAGTDGAGVYYSKNHGERWFEGNDGLTNLIITDIVISPLGYIFAGSDGKGVFKAKYK
jgi:hypothetical protein